MKREIVLYPAADAATYPWQADPNGSIYGGSSQIAYWRALKEGWDFPHGSGQVPPSADKNAWIAAGTLALVGNSALIASTIDPAPTLALFTKLTIEALVDYGQGRPNDWWFPPDNAYGPRFNLALRSRDGSSYHYGTTYEIVDAVPTPPYQLDREDINLNFNTGISYTGPASLSWELLAHPEGGPFTLSDMNHLAIGVLVNTSNGPSGLPVFNTKFHRLRILALRLRVEIQDLGGYVRSVRHNASATLRMKRRVRNVMRYTVPVADQPKEIGEVTHIAKESQGGGVKPLERLNGQIVGRTYWPEALKIVDDAFDLRDYSCEAWAAFRIPIAWTPELSGLAYLDQGGEFTETRAQDAWSLRPGDGAALRVLEDYANLSEDGLACHTGGDESLALYSQNFTTGWTSTDVAGGLTFSVETGVVAVDELGYQTATRFTFGGTPGAGGKKQVFALTAGDVVNIRARVQNLTVDASKFLEVAFLDNSGNYWDGANRTWSASPVYNSIDGSKSFGETILNQIPIANTEDHTLKIGRFSSNISQATFVVGLSDLFLGGDGCGMPLINLDATSTRIGDVFEMANDGDFTFMHRSRGFVIAEIRPFGYLDAMAEDVAKPIFYAGHASAHYDRLDIIPKDATADLIRFTREDTGGTQTLDVEILDSNGDPLDLTRDHILRVWVRWLDSQGFGDHGPYEAAIGYAVFDADGNFLATGEGSAVFAAPDATLEDFVRWGSDGTLGLDGWLRLFEVKQNPVDGTEAFWRK